MKYAITSFRTVSGTFYDLNNKGWQKPIVIHDNPGVWLLGGAAFVELSPGATHSTVVRKDHIESLTFKVLEIEDDQPEVEFKLQGTEF